MSIFSIRLPKDVHGLPLLEKPKKGSVSWSRRIPETGSGRPRGAIGGKGSSSKGKDIATAAPSPPPSSPPSAPPVVGGEKGRPLFLWRLRLLLRPITASCRSPPWMGLARCSVSCRRPPPILPCIPFTPPPRCPPRPSCRPRRSPAPTPLVLPDTRVPPAIPTPLRRRRRCQCRRFRPRLGPTRFSLALLPPPPLLVLLFLVPLLLPLVTGFVRFTRRRRRKRRRRRRRRLVGNPTAKRFRSPAPVVIILIIVVVVLSCSPSLPLRQRISPTLSFTTRVLPLMPAASGTTKTKAHRSRAIAFEGRARDKDEHPKEKRKKKKIGRRIVIPCIRRTRRTAEAKRQQNEGGKRRRRRRRRSRVYPRR